MTHRPAAHHQRDVFVIGKNIGRRQVVGYHGDIVAFYQRFSDQQSGAAAIQDHRHAFFDHGGGSLRDALLGIFC